MMYSKIALRNLKRNKKDYAVYMLTVVLSVALFYSFNAMAEQDAFREMLSGSTILSTIVKMLSLVLTGMLATLIIYANRFLVRRRQKELGIYVSLGMEQNAISKLFCFETVLVGAGSIVVGLLAGVALAQIFAMMIFKMFAMEITKLQFTFSGSAVGFTLLVFAVTFILVSLFNFLTISKLTLLQLLYGGQKNEKLKLKNRIVGTVLFFLSLAMYAGGFFCILHQGIEGTSTLEFKTGVGLVIVGTVLFYLFLPALTSHVLMNRKSFAYRDIRIFSMRQISSKLSINSVLLGVLALAISISIGGFSFGMAMQQSLLDGVNQHTPFEINIGMYSEKGQSLKKNLFDEKLKQLGYEYKSDTSVQKYLLRVQDEKMAFSDILTAEGDTFLKEQAKSTWDVVNMERNGDRGYTYLAFLSESELNRYLATRGHKGITIGEGEYKFVGSLMKPKHIKELQTKLKPIAIGGKEYRPTSDTSVPDKLNLLYSLGYYLIVVPDSAVQSLEKGNVRFTADLNRPLSQEDALELSSVAGVAGNKAEAGVSDLGVHFTIDTRVRQIAAAKEGGVTTTFLGLYIGTVFMIIVAAVLALQQMVNAAEQKQQYQILGKLGAKSAKLKRTILTQIGIYFGAPMALGFLNGGLITWVWNDWLFNMNGGSSSARTLFQIAGIGIAAFLVVYGLYFLLTYQIYKRTVLEDLDNG